MNRYVDNMARAIARRVGAKIVHTADTLSAAVALDALIATLRTDPQAVEAMARAMAVADGKDPDQPAWTRYPGPTHGGICWRDQYAGKASGGIEALCQHLERDDG